MTHEEALALQKEIDAVLRPDYHTTLTDHPAGVSKTGEPYPAKSWVAIWQGAWLIDCICNQDAWQRLLNFCYDLKGTISHE